MKPTNRAACLLFIIFASITAALGAAPKVAVLDVTLASEVDQTLVVPVTETIMEALVGSKAFTVLDRAYVEQVLKEKEFQLSGLVSDTEATKAGQYLGADFVVAGKAQLAAGSYFFVAKMIDVKTGIIVAQASEQAEGKVLVLIELARKVGSKLVASGGSTTVAATAGTAASAATAIATTTPLAAGASGATLRVGVVHDNSGFAVKGLPLPLEYAGIYAKDRFGAKVEILNVHDVKPDAFAATVDALAVKGCSVIIFHHPVFDAPLMSVAAKYPSIRFVALNHGLPKDRLPNMHVVAGHWEEFNYVLGILAGAATKNGKIGFLAIVPEPWQWRLINEFALGVRAVNPKAVVHVRYYGWDWSPVNGLAQARALVAEGCDTFGPVNFPNVLEWFASEASRGKPVLAIGEEQPWRYQPRVMIAGPVRNFGALFEAFLAPVLEGAVPPPDHYGVDMNVLSWPGEPAINPDLVAILSAKKVSTPDLGMVTAVDMAMRRMDQLRDGLFEIFVGPLKDQKGKLRLAAGDRASFDPDFYNRMDWLLDNVKDVRPK